MTGATTKVPVSALPLPAGRGTGLTHRGRVRERNEDSILTDPSGKLWAVADGMGGYGNGDVASDIVIECLSRIPDDAEPMAALISELANANRRVLERASGAGRMGSTVVAAIIERAMAHIAWVGDSRAYLMRAGHLRLLTRDHSVVQDMVERGEILPGEAEQHPESHIVTRAIGGDESVEPDTRVVPLFEGDRLLLCSDGLTRAVFEPAIAALLAEAPGPEAACRDLVRAALEEGGPDNVSVIVIEMREDSR